MDVYFFLNNLDVQLQGLIDEYPELKTQSRAFVAWALREVANVPDDDVVDCIVDGYDDKGIDAIYVPNTGEKLVVLQATRPENPEKNFPGDHIVKVLNGVDWLLSGELEGIANLRLRSKAEEFRQQFTSVFPSVEICLVAPCKLPTPTASSEIPKFSDKHNTLEDTFTVEIFDIERMFETYRRNLTRTPPNKLELSLVDAPYERDVGGVKALIGSIRGAELVGLYEKFGNSLFAANIRNYLGNVKINSSIVRTATDPDQAEYFFFYNNGITIVCDELAFRSTKQVSRVQLTNAQVVNGCQTVNSLYQASRTGRLKESVELVVRILEKEDPDFMQKVTRNTNSQNAVKAPDLVGTDPIQLQLKKDMESLGSYYETRRGDFRADYPDRAAREKAFGQGYREKIVRLQIAAQAYASFFLQIPATAKSSTTRLFDGKSDGGFYDDIFNKETTARKIVGVVGLMRRITEARKDAVAKGAEGPLAGALPWLPHADHFLLALFCRMFFTRDLENDSRYIPHFFVTVNSSFEDLHKQAVKRVTDYFSKKMPQKKRPRQFSFVAFFKAEQSYVDLAAFRGQETATIPPS